MDSTCSAAFGTTRNDGGRLSGVTVSTMSGEFANSFLNSAYAASFDTNRTRLTSGIARSWCSMALICSDVTSGFMKIESSTPPFHCTVAFWTPWRSRRAPPTSPSDTATVRIAAEVISRLRLRLIAVSRAT